MRVADTAIKVHDRIFDQPSNSRLLEPTRAQPPSSLWSVSAKLSESLASASVTDLGRLSASRNVTNCTVSAESKCGRYPR